MKKLFGILVIGCVLLLTGCSERMRGETTTVCTMAQSTVLMIVNDATVTLVGNDEDIVRRTERFEVHMEAFEAYLFGVSGVFLDDDELKEWFDEFNQELQGYMSWNIVSIDGNTMTLDFVYYYENLDDDTIATLWGMPASHVTLTLAISNLEYGGASCTTN